MLQRANEGIERIRRGLMGPIESANKTIEFLKANNLASSAIFTVRAQLLLFMRYSRLGLDSEDLKVAVLRVSRRPRVLAAKLPTRDEMRSLLLAAPVKTRLLISMLISTGVRIGEVIKVKVSDIDFAQNPVQVYFRETKTGPTRIGFLSYETVEFLQRYLKARKLKHEYIFDGHKTLKAKRMQPRDLPLSHTTAWGRINSALRLAEMDQRHDGIHYYYRPQTFRVLFLALTKGGGFPADWAEYLVGHYIGASASYLPTSEDLAKERLKIEDRFCFLTGNPKRIEVNPPLFHSKLVAYPLSLTKHSSPTNGTQENACIIDNATHRWASSSWLFVKADMHSMDFHQALADGYAIYDGDGASLRLLRKHKSYPKSKSQKASSSPLHELRILLKGVNTTRKDLI